MNGMNDMMDMNDMIAMKCINEYGCHMSFANKYAGFCFLLLLASQSEGILERINEPPWGRCLQGAVDARWVVVVVLLLLSSPRITSSRALGITVTLLRSNGDASMGLDDGAMR